MLPKIIGEGRRAKAETNDTVTVIAAALSRFSTARRRIRVFGNRPLPATRPMVNISPNKRKSMVVALNGAQDFLAEDLLDITKENEIENAAVSEAAALSQNVIARKLTEHAAYSTSLFPRITQV